MCGIIGTIAFHDKEIITRRDFFTQGLLTTSLRGTDGTGFFGVPLDPKKHEMLYYKKAIPSYDILQLSQVARQLQDIEHYKFMVGHCRAKTRGNVVTAHTHPFQIGNITMVHNGSIMNSYSLAGNKYYDVDSMAICDALAVYEDPIDALKQIDGAYALVWYDSAKDTLFMTRNDQRPLFFGIDKKNEIVGFASEQGMLEWIGARNGLEFTKVFDVGEHQLVSFKDSIDYDVVKYSVPKKTTTNAYQGAYNTANFQMGGRHGTSDEGIKYHGVAAKEHLKVLGVELGQEIEFTSPMWTVRTAKSRHGVLEGMMNMHPYSDVVGFGLTVASYEDADILIGRVIGAQVKGKNTAIIIGGNIRLKEVDKSKSGNKVIYLPPPQEKREQTLEPYTENGPHGLITKSEFSNLTEGGCVQCQAAIFDSYKLRWTKDNRPVCRDCVRILTMNGETGELLQ